MGETVLATAEVASSRRDVVVAHTSDVHIDHESTARMFQGDAAGGLRAVLVAARRVQADVVLLAGDTFDSHRLPQTAVEQSAATLREFDMPIVLLPGNHDPAVQNALFHRPALAEIDCLRILGVTHPHAVLFPDLELEVWGRAHCDYGDMEPLAQTRPRTTRWQIAMAHGHYMPAPDRAVRLRPSWLIGDDEIAATGSDYVAIGHWNQRVSVGRGAVPAWYSGSPDFARTINVVRLLATGEVEVGHAPLVLPDHAPTERF